MTRGRGSSLWLAAVILAVIAAPAAAQDFRGSIVGTIKDASGGVLPGVTVVITHNETKVSQTVITDSKGAYQARYLNVGTYTVTASLSGFKKMVQANAPVKVGDDVRVDFVLEAGGVTEVVEVKAETPLINTTTGVSGITVDAKQIALLPLGDGTAYMLTRLAPGIMDNSDLHFARPMDNANLGGIVTNGVQGGNEFTIDGAPNLSNAKGVGFSPPSDSIAQFKVQTNAFDAQAGHTAGAVVNLALKSGTNTLHGQVGYFNRNDNRTATPLLTERANGTKPTREYNRFTATGSGAIVRNKTFFMVSYEHLRDVQPEPATYTVPTMLMRQGDFSEFANQVYNPYSATSVGGVITRTPFANNRIPVEMLNPVARAYASYYPEPNQTGTNGNYFTNQLRPYDYDVILGRVDHNITSSNRIFGTGYYNKRREDRFNWALGAPNSPDGLINGFPITSGFDYRSNTGLTGGWTLVPTGSTVLDVRVSGTRFGESRDPAQDFDPALLGFSSTALQMMAGHQILPLMTFGSFSTTNSGSTIASLGTQRSDWREGFARPMTTIAVQPTLTWLKGNHSVRTGYDMRHQTWDITDTGYPAGRFNFNGAYTRATNSAGLNDRAQSWAQFMLGLPTAGTNTVANSGNTSSQFEIAAPGTFSQMSHAFFVQDDWRMSNKLTINVGARIEALTGLTESADRNLAGFDTTSANPVEAAAVAAYANAPITEVPVADFKVKGGLLFADGPANTTTTRFLPRAAVSYLITPKTVIRAGIGMFSYDFFFENINQAGFSQATPVTVTTDNGLTFTGANLTNPIPSGNLQQPVGSALGLGSQLGTQLGTIYQPDREVPYYNRWEVSVQREFAGGWMTSVAYLGSRGRNLSVVRSYNNIPMQFLTTSRTRDTALESRLSQNVTNPFAGLIPSAPAFNGALIARNQLMRPFPQFSTFSIEQYDGTDSYEGVTFMAEKRFKGSNSFTVQYTRSSTRDKLNYLNPADNTLEDRISPNDRPNRFSLGGTVQIPFGRDAKWGTEWHPALDAVLGGWRVSGTYQYQSGFPLLFNNSLYWDESCGDPTKTLKSNIGKSVSGGIAGLDVPGWDTSCFYFHDAPVQTNGVDDIVKQRADPRINLNGSNNVRYFPSTLEGVRTHHLNLFDFGINKNFALPKNVTMQLRIELINALNYTVLWNPGLDPRATSGLFGIVNQDRNNPRDIQLGLRFTF